MSEILNFLLRKQEPKVYRRGSKRANGSVTGKIRTQAQIRHKVPYSSQHLIDHQTFSERRADVLGAVSESFDYTTLCEINYPSVGLGMMYDSDFNELSETDYVKTIIDTIESRKLYIPENPKTKKDGSIETRETTPLHYITVTFNPVFARTLQELEKQNIENAKNFLRDEILPVIKAEFENYQPHEIITLEVHAGDGMLHIHITFSVVDRKQKLTWIKNGPGKKGVITLGADGIGNIRSYREGLIPKSSVRSRFRNLESRRKRLLGDEPIDYILAQTVDAVCHESFSRDHERKKILRQCRAEYHVDFKDRHKDHPTELKKRLAELQKDNQRLIRELDLARCQISTFEAHQQKSLVQNNFKRSDPIALRLAGHANERYLKGQRTLSDIVTSMLDDGEDIVALADWAFLQPELFSSDELAVFRWARDEAELLNDVATSSKVPEPQPEGRPKFGGNG